MTTYRTPSTKPIFYKRIPKRYFNPQNIYKNHISKILTSFEEHIGKITVNNRVGFKIEPAKFEPETRIENKIDEIKYDHLKNIDSLDMNVSGIKSNNTYSSYEYIFLKSNSCTTYKTLKETVHHVKDTTIHPSTAPK